VQVSELWPDPSVPYDYPSRAPANKARWSAAVTSALAGGTLRLLATDDSGPTDFYELSGRCPRCDHRLDPIPIEFDVIMGASPVRTRTGVFDVQCNCRGAHPGRDEKIRGCGWGGSNAVRLSVTG
jgi:hypothetical protein